MEQAGYGETHPAPDPPFLMTSRFLRLALACALVSLVAVSAALAAPTPRPLLLGFQDEQSFLWSANRLANLDRAATAHASVVRVTANWRQIAPQKRFAHLLGPDSSGLVEQIQAKVDADWEALQARCASERLWPAC